MVTLGRSAAVLAVLLRGHRACVAAALASGAPAPLPGQPWDAAHTLRVVVVDTRPLLEGQETLAALAAAGVPCAYTQLTGVHGAGALPGAAAVLLGAVAVFGTGAVLGRAGTAALAAAARHAGVPVYVAAESFKFADSASLDACSGGSSELGPADALVHPLASRPAPVATPPNSNVAVAVAAAARAAARAASAAASATTARAEAAAPAKPPQPPRHSC